jgi:hypothetical protein
MANEQQLSPAREQDTFAWWLSYWGTRLQQLRISEPNRSSVPSPEDVTAALDAYSAPLRQALQQAVSVMKAVKPQIRGVLPNQDVQMAIDAASRLLGHSVAQSQDVSVEKKEGQ